MHFLNVLLKTSHIPPSTVSRLLYIKNKQVVQAYFHFKVQIEIQTKKVKVLHIQILKNNTSPSPIDGADNFFLFINKVGFFCGYAAVRQDGEIGQRKQRAEPQQEPWGFPLKKKVKLEFWLASAALPMPFNLISLNVTFLKCYMNLCSTFFCTCVRMKSIRALW